MKKTKELSPYERAIMKRIVKLIDEYCDGSQKIFVDKTGLNKGSVSQYVNGKNTPSWENAEKIAAAFNIDVTWVMAIDVIPDGIESPDGNVPSEAVILYKKFQAADPETRQVIQRLLKDF